MQKPFTLTSKMFPIKGIHLLRSVVFALFNRTFYGKKYQNVISSGNPLEEMS